MNKTMDKNTASKIAVNLISPETLNVGDMAVFDVDVLNRAWALSIGYIKSDKKESFASQCIINRFMADNVSNVAPTCELFRDKKRRVLLHFRDGRHRFSVLRDHGVKEIMILMPKKSLRLAKRTGMIISNYENAVPCMERQSSDVSSYFDIIAKKIKKLPRKRPWSLLKEELRLVEDHVSMKPNASGCWVRKQYDRLEGQYNNLIKKHESPVETEK